MDIIGIFKRNKYLAESLFISLVFFLPFMMNNLPYNDDYYKSMWGQSHFVEDGRPVAEFIVRVFSLFSTTLNDVSPLTWIISFLVLGTSCYTANKRINGQSSFMLALSSLFIFCSPNYIDNSMYKYDVLTMSVSLSIAILSATVFIRSLPSFLLVLAGNLLYLCTYQLSLSSYIIIAILFFSVRATRDVNIASSLYDLILKGLALLSSYVIYALIKPLMDVSKYAAEMGEMVALKHLPEHVFGSVEKYVNLLISLYDTPSLVSISLSSFLAIAFLVCTTGLVIRNNAGNFIKVASCAILLIAIPFSLFMTFAPLAMLKRQPDTLRMFVGVGSYVYMCMTLSWYLLKEFRYIKYFIVALMLSPLAYTISITYAVNNAYKSQYDLSNGVSLSVVHSINNLDVNSIKEIKYTTSNGPLAYETDRLRNDHPFTKKFIRDGFTAIPHWAGYVYQSKIKVGEWFNSDQTKEACGGIKIADGVNYDMYKTKDIIYVDMTKSRCK
ncbi:glucosyltransferase domain-containing protein [Enterobacter kobei]|uniref:glucosyltransferase domain-containing protein n=1 Tax=Enterobacter kobei TaxID=208224 RepID=UPI001254D761|nr:glucosyltransferase domain-containing protein [Enterobacter kobei]VAX69506.1 Uncharacterised protein [Enterobacter kobei]